LPGASPMVIAYWRSNTTHAPTRHGPDGFFQDLAAPCLDNGLSAL
jgi:hypothetical protein